MEKCKKLKKRKEKKTFREQTTKMEISNTLDKQEPFISVR
jgi:hypothetical protein